MVSRAAVIVGVHGAALTHQLFMPPGGSGPAITRPTCLCPAPGSHAF
jgi:capsular polysaccharide biosynthesis protein